TRASRALAQPSEDGVDELRRGESVALMQERLAADARVGPLVHGAAHETAPEPRLGHHLGDERADAAGGIVRFDREHQRDPGERRAQVFGRSRLHATDDDDARADAALRERLRSRGSLARDRAHRDNRDVATVVDDFGAADAEATVESGDDRLVVLAAAII